ncbi:hypothetical protein [Desulfonatronum sp. SC1]|uniref:hypothetical protein n=1 Tax=Desulfonatronum sp. SC1 TaxID=2109626 RepID=UPI000D2F87C2|nr:hypothetical protein [Desulfonatronum sp. SC1]PTN32878.1 hypothetical protein C6366_15635 [Desulfonatronum sp. SC1]
MRHLRMLLLLAVLLPAASLPAAASGFDALPVSSQAVYIEQQFALFSQNWIDKIDRNFISRLGNVEFVNNGSGYVGRYMQVDRDSVAWSVKQAVTGPGNYIGVLEYIEWTYECAAENRDAAALGPFVQVHGRKVTEIFQYHANRWLE